MRMMMFGLVLVVCLGSVGATLPATQPATTEPAASEPAARPGLAIRFSVEGDEAKVIVAMNYLQSAKDLPKFDGVRFYTYDVPLTDAPTRVGLAKAGPLDGGPVNVVMEGRKYAYLATAMDRQENGTLSLTKPEKEGDAYRLRGVYYYMGQLFVINASLQPKEALLLFESPAAAK